MPFIQKSPLEYQVNSADSQRRYQLDRAPTISDFKQFRVGDLWLDTSSDDWWILCYRDLTQGIWRKVAGTASAVETFIPDAGTSPVVPTATNQITIVGGNGILTTGGLNQWTTAMLSPYDGSFAFENATAATPITLTVENNDVDVASSASLVVSAEPLAGDAFTLLEIDATQQYSVGIDNSDSDNFKITDGASPSLGTVFFQLTTAGVPTFPAAPLDVPSGGTGVTAITDHALIVGSGVGAITEIGPLTDGQLVIGSTGLDPVAATLTAGTGIGIVNAAGSITINSTGGGLTWSTVGASTPLLVNNGFICTAGAALSFSLPATSAVGDCIGLSLGGSASWTITMAGGQSIRIGNVSTSGGGTLVSTAQGDTLEMICDIADTHWFVKNLMGNITVT